ncbi:MAG: hypothetical protein J6K32_01605 [Clostridia bacterium]|nr:hypothetical protein [Clostridia bacterium]
MKYFVTEHERKESGSTCYYEFHKGDWDENTMDFWREDSISLHDDVMYESGFDSLIMDHVPEYAPFGTTRISAASWAKIVQAARRTGGEIAELVLEADAWALGVFEEHEVFTILGL